MLDELKLDVATFNLFRLGNKQAYLSIHIHCFQLCYLFVLQLKVQTVG